MCVCVHLSCLFLVLADMGSGQVDDSVQSTDGQQQPSLNTTRLLDKYLPETDLVLHIGDISYANGYSSVWEEFFDQVQSVASSVPYMVCIGNHERDYPNTNGLFNVTDSAGECGVPYENRFAMPTPAPDQPWYGFDYGSAHFVLMSTEHFFDPTSPQYQFLDAHLKSVDRSRTPWLIFAGHRPMYVDSTGDKHSDSQQPVAKLLRTYLEPLLHEYKVDLALWGHHHLYHRSCPVYQEVCLDQGTVHVLVAMGGHDLSDNVESSNPAWLEYLDYKHWGMTRLTMNSTTLLFEYIHNDDGMVHDKLVLTK
ncbi:Probable inactive purple acid phosphatase 27 [Geodia barretti]|uniref:Probable inactive purple acid phosphatase 27 n=1 Tax=Geodia barretti TaxID=519541 RepID=A0AA35WCU2_GEOBA|nr:Probable inactive purple acid phosphatase 27 [Geodia barretti]